MQVITFLQDIDVMSHSNGGKERVKYVVGDTEQANKINHGGVVSQVFLGDGSLLADVPNIAFKTKFILENEEQTAAKQFYRDELVNKNIYVTFLDNSYAIGRLEKIDTEYYRVGSSQPFKSSFVYYFREV